MPLWFRKNYSKVHDPAGQGEVKRVLKGIESLKINDIESKQVPDRIKGTQPDEMYSNVVAPAEQGVVTKTIKGMK